MNVANSRSRASANDFFIQEKSPTSIPSVRLGPTKFSLIGARAVCQATWRRRTYMHSILLLLVRHAAQQRQKVLSRTFGCGASKGVEGTLRRMYVWIPAEHRVAVLGAMKVTEWALKNKGLLSASPSRVDDIENPTLFLNVFSNIARHPRTLPLLYIYIMCSTSAEAAAVTTATAVSISRLSYLLHQAL